MTTIEAMSHSQLLFSGIMQFSYVDTNYHCILKVLNNLTRGQTISQKHKNVCNVNSYVIWLSQDNP